MSNLLLDLDELHVRHERSEENKIQLFDSILKQCHNKIKKYNTEFKKQECLFAPPVFVLGHPPYDYGELLAYLIISLRKNGLKAEWLDQQKSLYISWRKSDVDMTQYHTHFTDVVYGDTIEPGITLSPHGSDAPNFAVLEVRPKATPGKKKSKKGTAPQPTQHVGLFEYGPGVKDFIPINYK